MCANGIIIGIGGLSRSGKSFLADQLAAKLQAEGKSVNILSQDDFVFPEEEIPLIRSHIDWESPDSIDFQGFKDVIRQSAQKHDFTFAEGLLSFWDSSLSNDYDYCFFIELSQEEYIRRKNMDLRWGKEPDWYVEHIWNSFQKYGQIPQGMKMDMILNGDNDFDIAGIYKKIIRADS
ncbi:MAG: hypothetical protein HN352_11735 [Bacteroidetes bacterium]|jgi:nicotinamide/nicotinate riboside kinase|nr:hypothetical protein [Bacteroidota bacterium]MBT4400531.1 hypothetical protein [Bacteroidota bacterium]MBT4408839.1 hypothetical protein [Bacteroidota bacterium]MBT5427754.1 hypothetical protein [Bacteroidota bacterium]MBT7094080.1 hypothetical protein [Bacteroidota bacterium]